MRFKYIEYKRADNESVIFGKKDVNKESDLQLISVSGLQKNTTKVFKNDVIDSSYRIFRGNRLEARQVQIKVAYQPKTSLLNSTEKKWENKEKFLVELISFLETTSIQTPDKLGTLILTSRNGNQYVIDGVIVESIEAADDSKAYNNYVELIITIRSNNPYIKSGVGLNTETFNLASQTVLTDFVDDPTVGSTALEFKLENQVEAPSGTVASVRDGYISNDGIFYAVENYGEDISETFNGQFWLTDSLQKTITNNGSTTYPKIKINGYVENPRITNVTTGQVFQLNYTIEEGQYVIVDMKNKTCVLFYTSNGIEITQDIRDFISNDSSWLSLSSGSNQIEISFSSGSQESFKIEFGWETLLEGIAI